MNTLSHTLKLALCGSLLILFSCTPREEATENPQATNFDKIEIGTTLEDARALLADEFIEYKVGETPDVDLIVFEDGRQLVFMDNVLTNKNTTEELEEVKSMSVERSEQ